MANDLKTYQITLTVSPSVILSNFEPEEQSQLLEHFGSAEALTDWIMDGIIDYFQGDGFEHEMDDELWNLGDRLDAECRGEQFYL